MKIELDTTEKSIKVEETVNLGEFIEAIKRLLPNGEWKEFKLETQIVIDWNNPTIIKPCNPYEPYWYNYPWTTCDTNKASGDCILTTGVYTY